MSSHMLVWPGEASIGKFFFACMVVAWAVRQAAETPCVSVERGGERTGGLLCFLSCNIWVSLGITLERAAGEDMAWRFSKHMIA